MAHITFTEDEIRAALPKPTNGRSLAGAWEMFSDPDDPTSKYHKGEEAAEFVHTAIVKILTNAPFNVKFDGGDSFGLVVDDLGCNLNRMVAGALRHKYGTYFGFTDTEPRNHTVFFVRRLFGLDR